MGERIEDERQIDLEEAIEARGGRPYRKLPVRPLQEEYQTARGMYAPLHRVLMLAYQQSAFGKGKDRHANDKPFMQQPIMEITRMHGLGFTTGQASKKGQEAVGMASRLEHEAAKRELLGAIVYLAAAYLYVDETQGSTVDSKDQGR